MVMKAQANMKKWWNFFSQKNNIFKEKNLSWPGVSSLYWFQFQCQLGAYTKQAQSVVNHLDEVIGITKADIGADW